MKILVLGGTGMAGHVISIYLKESGHDVTVFSRTQIDYCENIVGDITDFENLVNILDEGNYDSVVNAIGILNQEAENNKSKAVLLNSYLPHFLSDILKGTNTKIIHLSTDCVFSGNKGAYIESSLKDGMTFYDRSKALGELDNCKDLTFRNSIIGPDINENGVGLFNWFMKQKETIFGYDKVIWTGVTTITLSKAIEQALKENLTGLYHLVNNETISKFELLMLFNLNMKENKIDIIRNNEIEINKSLINTRNDFSFCVPSYEIMILEMKEWVKNHIELYPHYLLRR